MNNQVFIYHYINKYQHHITSVCTVHCYFSSIDWFCFSVSTFSVTAETLKVEYKTNMPSSNLCIKGVTIHKPLLKYLFPQVVGGKIDTHKFLSACRNIIQFMGN